eukprot:PhM_4_TR629/c0_g1_i1/m.30092
MMTTTTIDGLHWMRDIAPYIQNLSLSQVLLPGSHDSCTCSITPSSELAPSCPPITHNLNSVPGLGGVMRKVTAGWSKTQSMSPLDQLRRGVRYLDVRVSTKKNVELHHRNDLWTLHGMYNEPLQNLLTDVQTFLIESESHEIVLLDMNHLFGFEEEDHRLLVQMLKEALGPFLLCKSDLPQTCGGSFLTLPLHELWSSMMMMKRLIVFYKSEFVCIEQDCLWHTYSAIHSKWMDKMHLAPLTASLSHSMALLGNDDNYNPHVLHVTQAILTPNSAHIRSGVISSPFQKFVKRPTLSGHHHQSRMNSIHDFAKMANSHLFEWWSKLSGAARRRRNIIIFDYVEIDDVVQKVIALNVSQSRVSTFQDAE